jgi:hypothetical protein
MAQKAREALQGVEGIASAVVDTTGRAIVRAKANAKPDEEKMNEALKSANNALKIRKLQKRDLDAPAAIVEVRLEGFG